jgi:hypothetical protein
MHSLCRLIESAVRSADWDLPQLAGTQAAVGEPAGEAAPRVLN